MEKENNQMKEGMNTSSTGNNATGGNQRNETGTGSSNIGSKMNQQHMGSTQQQGQKNEFGQTGDKQYGQTGDKQYGQDKDKQYGQDKDKQYGQENRSSYGSQNDSTHTHDKGQCDPCQKDFDKNIDKMVDQVEGYDKKEHNQKETEVEGAYGSNQQK